MANPRTIARLEARILERAAYCLQFEVRDPRASFVTVTRVKLSPDLSSGRIYYSVLGSEGDKSKAAHMLESAAGFIQRQVGRVLQMRRMPHLGWIYDDSMERASEISRLIQEARARDREINPAVDLPAAEGPPAEAPGAGPPEGEGPEGEGPTGEGIAGEGLAESWEDEYEEFAEQEDPEERKEDGPGAER